MSSASQANIERWNMYKSRVESAGSAVIRATQYLVRPTEGFPAGNPQDIQYLWRTWRDEEECYWRMTTQDTPPKRVFPAMPASDAEECCYRMWGLLIQVQVDGTHGSTEFLRQTVLDIAANEKCKSHPATCSCHVPDHPWVYKEDVDALEPIKPHHNPKCGCAGWNRCAQKMMAAAAAAAAVRAKKEADEAMAQQGQQIAQQMAQGQKAAEQELAVHPELKVGPCRCDAQYANVMCSCLAGRIADAKKAAGLVAAVPLTAPGFLPPVAAATGGAAEPKVAACHCYANYTYLKCTCVAEPVADAKPAAAPPYSNPYTHKVETCPCGTCHKARVDSGMEEAYTKRCREASNAALARLSTSPPRQESCAGGGFGAALNKASAAIAKAAAASGGSIDHPDFVKNLFAAMGTPHDSKCPHGLPFYACMPCSH